MSNYLVKNNNLFGDAFDSLFAPIYKKSDFAMEMKTDIKEYDDRYEFNIDMPGFDKEDIELNYEKGYLSVSAQKKEEKSEENDKGYKYLHQERVTSCKRDYYIGEQVEDGIKAKYENGILSITVAKPVEKPEKSGKILIE